MDKEDFQYEKKINNLAEEVLNLSRNSLTVNLRFLDSAMSRLTHRSYDGTIATDGEYIYYDPRHVLRVYKYSKEMSVRNYLHMVFHCVFRHFFINALVNETYWNLACDIAVENIINELDIPATKHKFDNEQKSVISELKNDVKQLTAEKLYRYFLDNKISEQDTEKLETIFAADDHSKWYEVKLALSSNKNELSSDKDGKLFLMIQSAQVIFEIRQNLCIIWEDISESMQIGLETFFKTRGDSSGSLVQNLKSVNREKYDYTNFLKQFAVSREAMKVNDDEFDYIFYTYGLQLYENMPLIEPLEYKDIKRIKEFVIAIDTSGSVAGDLVQRFVQKTYNVLKQEESFFTKINIHIIQCDSLIQEDVKITTQQEFDTYLERMELHGFGGTDFRPVFKFVDELIRQGEFTDLRGLIYFTDGYGVFPKSQPNYKTAFVFIEDDYEIPEVPVWAIKLILQSEEI